MTIPAKNLLLFIDIICPCINSKKPSSFFETIYTFSRLFHSRMNKIIYVIITLFILLYAYFIY